MHTGFSGASSIGSRLRQSSRPIQFQRNRKLCSVSRSAFGSLQPTSSHRHFTPGWQQSGQFLKGSSPKRLRSPPRLISKFSMSHNEQKKRSESLNEARQGSMSRRGLGKFFRNYGQRC